MSRRLTDIDINIVRQYGLGAKRDEMSSAELELLRREKPLQAAVYLMQRGRTDEAKELADDVQKRLKEGYEAVLAARTESLQATLAAARQEQAEYRREVARLKRGIDAMAVPPLSRAILCDLFEVTSPPSGDVPAPPAGEHRPAAASAADEVAHSGQAAARPASGADSPEPIYRAVIAVGSGRHEVGVSPLVRLPDPGGLVGLETWTAGPAMTVFKFGERYLGGTTAQVIGKCEGGRLRVKGRGNEELLVQMTPRMAASDEVEAGDVVLVVPEAELALELLEKANRQLTLDKIPNTTYDQIGGMDAEIEQIRKAVELPFIFRNVYRRYQLNRPKGILLYGPPGCGKTMVAKAIARSLYDHTARALEDARTVLQLYLDVDEGSPPVEILERARTAGRVVPEELERAAGTAEELRAGLCRWLEERQIPFGSAQQELRRVEASLSDGAESYFLSIKGPELLSKWVGESESNIRQIFLTARNKATLETPVILFFDEIESLFSRRGSGRSSDMEKTIVPQLLAEIDGVNALPNVLLIGASNRYDLIDPAVLRPGRLDIKIRVDRPNREAATAILRKYLTGQLPIDAFELRQAGGGIEEAIESLIQKTTDVFYNPGSYIVIYHRESRQTRLLSRPKKTLHKNLSEVVSGAMLANVVERAKRSAAEREVRRRKAGDQMSVGLNWADDLYPAIRQECEEGKDQHIFEAREGQSELAYIDADLFEAEVILKEVAEGERPVARWANFKERRWLAM